VERISDCVFAIEVDGRRLDISMERLKPAYFAAEQEEQVVNKPCSAIIDGTTLVEKASFHPKDLSWRTTIKKQTD